MKSEGRTGRREENKNPNLQHKTCKCGSNDHRTARSKDCPFHKASKKEIAQDILGSKREQYVRKIPFDSLVRPQFKDHLKHMIIDLSSQVREIVIRVQIFVNYYIIHRVQDNQGIPTYVYSQNFFYSIAQLVTGFSITNSNSNMPSDIMVVWDEFVLKFPDARCLPNLTGYSDALSFECKKLETIYSNQIVENFELYIAKYFKVRMMMSDPVSVRHSFLIFWLTGSDLIFIFKRTCEHTKPTPL
jgi:hypothetical protein